MNKQKIVLDTNILLANPHFIKENASEDKEFIIPIVVFKELSAQKSRGSDISWKSRKVLNALCDLTREEFYLEETCKEIYADDTLTNDMKIVKVAKELGATVYSQDKDVIIYSISNGVNVKRLTPKEIMSMDKDFKGIKWIDLETAEDDVQEKVSNLIYRKTKKGVEDEFGLYPNECLVIKQITNNNKENYFYYRKKRGLLHKITPYKTADLSAKNPEQVCALDILMDDDVPVKIITGVAGSGKTYLATNTVLKPLMSDGNAAANAKVMFLRNPDGHSDVKEIGFLKGTKEEKMGSFFKPIKDNVAGGNADFLLEKWADDNLIEFESPYFIKGRSLNNYTVLVDEAEDLNFSTVKLIGTRLGEGSSVAFVGK